jgi:D-serine deaminase-like pyridoxal phosphate-dependent protein
MKLDEVETPAVVIDEAVVMHNIARYQAYCDANGLALRPHIKTHKLARFARMQMAAGAVGIVCQKVSEAEVMASHGLDDILITYNILGAAKLARLRALAARVRALSVVADNAVVVEGLEEAFADARAPLPVLVECDTGAARCGVQTPAEAAALAQVIDRAPGLRFGGLMTYPAAGKGAAVAKFMAEAKALLAEAGLECPVVSGGGSPDMWKAGEVAGVTEHRIGTYIYNDRSLVERGSCGWEDCALTVHVTVVSTPAPGRAVIDAGSKGLTSDLLGLDGYGHVIGHDDVRITGLSEEHGVLEWGAGEKFTVGERLRIVPNHACPVSNLYDEVHIIGEGGEVFAQTVDARGTVT